MSTISGVRVKNPAHPGGFIKHEIIEPLGLSVTAAAQARRREGEIHVLPFKGKPLDVQAAMHRSG